METNNILLGLPIYNESQYVEDVLNAVQQHCENILVVNDGSTDDTSHLLNNFNFIQQINHPYNYGYGKSLIDIFNYAKEHKYEWVITMDCDWQHQPSHLPIFHQWINNSTADIISGSRYLDSELDTICVPKERIYINRRITSLLNRTLNFRLTDAFCGFKAYRTECLKKLNLRESGYGLPLELWIQAATHKMSIHEIPVPLIYHDPDRCFAGPLENPEIRLNYYLDIIEKNLSTNGHKNIERICCS